MNIDLIHCTSCQLPSFTEEDNTSVSEKVEFLNFEILTELFSNIWPESWVRDKHIGECLASH